ncbi:hypothetical protein L6R53_20460 [Myxococcota bacterium]|nr:hypothetical protein [Myxococcota bacterium]
MIGSVSGLQSEWRSVGTQRRAVTEVTVEVERVVRGVPLESVAFDILGGVIDGQRIEGPESPEPSLGDRYIWFLVYWSEQGKFMWLDQRALDPETAIPEETDLRHAWEQLCRAHPEGVPPVVGDAVATGPWMLDSPRTEHWAVENPAPILRSMLDLRPCRAGSAVREKTGLEEGLCIGGRLDFTRR